MAGCPDPLSVIARVAARTHYVHHHRMKEIEKYKQSLKKARSGGYKQTDEEAGVVPRSNSFGST